MTCGPRFAPRTKPAPTSEDAEDDAARGRDPREPLGERGADGVVGGDAVQPALQLGLGGAAGGHEVDAAGGGAQ